MPDHQTYARGTRNARGKQILGPQSSERDNELKLRCFDSISRDDLLQLEKNSAETSDRAPLQSLLSTDPDRLLAGDNGTVANPHYTDSATQLNPITCALTRDRSTEPHHNRTRCPTGSSAPTPPARQENHSA